MQRSIPGNVSFGVMVVALMLITGSAVNAQPITDAKRVEFTPSTDHNVVDPVTGIPVISNYSLRIYLVGSSLPLQSVDLGKPAPGTDGMVRLDFFSLLTTPLQPGVSYESTVAAVGPGGSADSTRSNTFVFSAACTPSISPTSQSVAAAGGTGSSMVAVAIGCAWTAVSNAPWITVTAGATGTASGTVTFSVAANTATTSRTGTMTIAGSAFAVTQAAAPCSYTMAPTSANVVATGGTGAVAVTAGSGCTWTAASSAAWITITAGATGNGNGTVSYSVAAHTGSAPRIGTVTAGGKSFTVTQPGAITPPATPTMLRIIK